MMAQITFERQHNAVTTLQKGSPGLLPAFVPEASRPWFPRAVRVSTNMVVLQGSSLHALTVAEINVQVRS